MKTGSPDVVIGGETVRVGFVLDLESWVEDGLKVLGLASLIGGGLFAAAAGLASFATFGLYVGGGYRRLICCSGCWLRAGRSPNCRLFPMSG